MTLRGLGTHCHDLRHIHKTWLIEDEMPEVLPHVRLGHKFHGIRGIYSHATGLMVRRLPQAHLFPQTAQRPID